MKNLKFITYLIAFVTCFALSSQEEETEEKPTFSVAGSIDTYFRSADYAPGTSFANLPGFALGMANVILSYEGEKSGFVADLVYGPRGTDAVFASNGSSNIVNLSKLTPDPFINMALEFFNTPQSAKTFISSLF